MTTKNHNSTYSRFVIPFSLLLFNFIIKSLYITGRDIALDEPFSIYYGQMDLKSIIQMLYNENNPPLHFFILHYFIKLFGIGALSVRMPSLIFSSFTAVIIFKIGNRFFNQLTGIGASLIFTFSSMHIFFSHEARVYPLFSFLTACSLYLFMLIIENPSTRKNFILLFICNLCLIYSHYFGFFVLFIEIFSLLFLKNRKDILKNIALMMSALAICYIPIIYIFMHRLGVSTSHGTWVRMPEITELYGNLNRFLNNKYNTLVLIIILLTALTLLIKQKKLTIQVNELFKNIYFKIVLIWFVVPYIVMFLVSYKYPMFIDRYILFTSIPFFIVVAIMINHFFKTPKHAIIAFSILILSQLLTIQLNPDNNRRLTEVVMLTKALKKENTITIIAPDYAYMGFCYHYNTDYFKDPPNTKKLLNEDKIFPVSNVKSVVEILNTQKNKNAPCIYIQAGSEFVDPKNEIYNAIKSKYKKENTFHVFEIYDIHYFTDHVSVSNNKSTYFPKSIIQH